MQQKECSDLKQDNAFMCFHITLNGIVLYICDVLLLAVCVLADINREKVVQTKNLFLFMQFHPLKIVFEVQV